MHTGRHSGQAAVEGIGVTVLVALLVAATALWLVQQARPPAQPPAVIDRVAQPLAGAHDPGLWAGASADAYRGLTAHVRGGRPIGRALRAVGRGVMAAVALEQEAEAAFHAGARARLRERLAGWIDDPVGGLTTLPDPADLSPTAIALRPLGSVGELWDYARRVRSMPPREAMRMVARDAGAEGTDILVDLVEAFVRRRVAGAASRRLPRPPPPASARTP